MVYANVFGGQFPVCNEKQKAEIEQAYADLMKRDAAQGGIKNKHECMCDLIITLLKGEGDFEIQVAAALFISKIIYMEKKVVEELSNQLEQVMMMQPSSSKETVH